MTEPSEEVRPFIPYEIPLHPDRGRSETARLVLPADLTAEEADKLCGVIRSLAFDTAALPNCDNRKDQP